MSLSQATGEEELDWSLATGREPKDVEIKPPTVHIGQELERILPLLLSFGAGQEGELVGLRTSV